jgi:hypothetical protein
MGCNASGTVTVPVQANRDYFAVVKGDVAADVGPYTLTVVDANAAQAQAGSTPVACVAEGGQIDQVLPVLPPGQEYYVAVTNPAADASGNYRLRVQDLDATQNANRISCDTDSGPNNSAIIEEDLAAGDYYLVVKGDDPIIDGTYRVNLRDVTQVDDRAVACASGDEKITQTLAAGQDYTLVMKGDQLGANGSYEVKLYDELGLQSGSGNRVACALDPPKDTFPPATVPRLADGNYYLAVKGLGANDKGYYQIDVGEVGYKGAGHYYRPPSY